MALPLHIPACVHTPAHQLHPPCLGKSLRIQIEGPLPCIQKLLPHIKWHTEVMPPPFPQPAGPELAKLTCKALYGQDLAVVVRDEYLGWITDVKPYSYVTVLNRNAFEFLMRNRAIDYYGVTFDYFVSDHDYFPEVLQLNIIGIDDDNGAYANRHLLSQVEPADYKGKKVLAVPRCCQKRKGTQDRTKINAETLVRDRELFKLKVRSFEMDKEAFLKKREASMKDSSMSGENQNGW